MNLSDTIQLLDNVPHKNGLRIGHMALRILRSKELTPPLVLRHRHVKHVSVFRKDSDALAGSEGTLFDGWIATGNVIAAVQTKVKGGKGFDASGHATRYCGPPK